MRVKVYGGGGKRGLVWPRRTDEVYMIRSFATREDSEIPTKDMTYNLPAEVGLWGPVYKRMGKRSVQYGKDFVGL